MSKPKRIDIPTGCILIDQYENGELETLSIGDYGKARNIKADFLGHTRELNGVPSGKCVPLSEKWVITLSTQYGCMMRCNFCDAPNIRFSGNVSEEDLLKQVFNALTAFQHVKYTDRLNIHFARMGEPTFNPHIIPFAKYLYKRKEAFQFRTGVRVETIHPVLTTMMPRSNKDLHEYITDWCIVKNELYRGQAGLQISINSTDEEQRNKMFNYMALSLEEIAKICKYLPWPLGRKYCLNIAYCTDYTVDALYLADLFDSDKFMVKITPIHDNNACRENGIKTENGYTSYAPYRELERELIAAGFDVLVFVPSFDEEDGCVTCGNAILGGSELNL